MKCIKWEINSKSQISRTDELVLQEQTPCSGRVSIVGVFSNNYRGVIMAAGENSPASFYGGIFAVLDLQRPNSLFGICYTSIFSKWYWSRNICIGLVVIAFLYLNQIHHIYYDKQTN